MTKLSKRAQEALEVLKDEGYFLYHLETDRYTGFVKFRTRLRNYLGDTVKGIGTAALNELKEAGIITRREAACSPTHTEYVLRA